MNETESMLTSILDCERIDLLVNPKPLTPDQQMRFDEMKRAYAAGEPLQYVIGHCEFMGLKLFVDSRVLIPRPETEILTDLVIQKIKTLSLNRPVKVLDLGTGSGNIAISIAKNIPNCFVQTVDISIDALDLAKKNAKEHNALDKIKFVNRDMRDYLQEANPEKFDVIISNPPYIPTNQLSTLPKDVQQEPSLALDGGIDGLDFYRAIAMHAHRHLQGGGFIFMEIGDGQDKNLMELLTASNNYENITFVKDYRDINRIVWANKSVIPTKVGI